MNPEEHFDRFDSPPHEPPPWPPEEVLVADTRARLTPAQMVEIKLASMLQSTPLPLSRLQHPDQHRPLP